MSLIKIKNIELTGKPKTGKTEKVIVEYEFFDGNSGSITIEFEKDHPYKSGFLDVVKIDKKVIDVEPNISIKKRGKFNSNDNINVLLIDTLNYGWVPIIKNNKVYLKYKRSPRTINWRTDNKNLRGFLIGLIAIAKNRGLISVKESFSNENEIRAELWRLFKNSVEKMKIKGIKCKLEYPVNRGLIDFLIKKHGKPHVVLECKPGDYKKGIPQAERYAKRLNVKYYGVCSDKKIVMISPKKDFAFNEKGIENFARFVQKL